MNLTSECIHFWYIPLDVPMPDSGISILSTAERQKANDFYFKNDQKKYLLRHIALRKILSEYCMLSPDAINFNFNNRQKPFIANNIYNLQFNMSSSGDMAILAIIKNYPIGVDIEYIKPIDEILNIVERFFSKKEISDFLLLSENKRLEAFYTIWTRKEAFVKAIGDGLSYPLDAFDVSFLSHERAQILKINNSEVEAKNWTLNCFTFNHLNNYYITAIITKSRVKHISKFYYPC